MAVPAITGPVAFDVGHVDFGQCHCGNPATHRPDLNLGAGGPLGVNLGSPRCDDHGAQWTPRRREQLQPMAQP